MSKIFASAYPFGSFDAKPKEMLLAEPKAITIYNPHKRKLNSKEILAYAQDAEIVIAGTENLNELIQSSHKLKLVSRVGIGLDNLDLKLCKSRGIKVSYTPDAVTMAVAEMTIGLMIASTRKLDLAE